MDNKWKWLFTGISYILVAVLTSVLTITLILVFDVFPKFEKVQSSKLTYLEQLILERYIGGADQKVIEDAAAQAMIEAMGDEWSYYIPKDRYEAYEQQTQNTYVGIGISVAIVQNVSGVEIRKVVENSPAAEAGLQVGDRIVGVDDKHSDDTPLDELVQLIAGEENTTVNLTILREGKQQTVTVTRRTLVSEVVGLQLLAGGVGLITIKNFNENCKDQAVAAIEELRMQGAKKLIFDVRYNPGGYVDELVPLLDYLLPEGVLFQTEDYAGNKDVKTSDASFLDMPMAVLVNQQSYSAAEFFAAALSEYEAAIVVGEQTYGKGYFQSVYKLPDGSAVGISIGKYYTPEGKNLAGVGITPDIAVPISQEESAALKAGKLPPEEDVQLQAAIAALSK